MLQEPDESLMAFIRNMPLKERFDVERRIGGHHGYSYFKGGAQAHQQQQQLDVFDSQKCPGSWPVHYMKMIRDQKQRPEPRRFIVHTCKDRTQAKVGEGGGVCGSISDRLMAAASLFTVSLLTDREFLIDWQDEAGHDSLNSSLRSPFLNLQSAHPLDIQPDGDKDTPQPISISLSDWDAADLDTVFDIRSLSKHLNSRRRRPSDNRRDSKVTKDIRSHLVAAPQLKVDLNRGLVQRILTDPSYSDQLKSMGLQQHSAYDCVLSFLFRPTLTTQSLITQYRAVFQTPGVTTIGIHLPSFSHVSSSGNDQQDFSDEHQRSVSCAVDLSRAIKMETKSLDERFLYVILTDSDQKRKQVQREYGHSLNLIFPPNPPRKPLAHEQRGQRDDSRTPYEEDEASVVLNSYLFSETDYQIVTTSSFSKIALFRRGSAGRQSAVLMPSRKEQAEGIPMPDCTQVESAVTPWELIASTGSLG
ncbi:hypothetical protein BGZ98_001586 [Dissophora globulifera]|nr:hypothetical protein BGZ98_001586 [Dissophora globulifera]